MGKNHSCSYALVLVASVSLNIFLVVNVYVGGGDWKKELSWTEQAAAEAEAVASISCSGHGRAYLDGSVDTDGKPVCECNTCFGGPDCSQLSPDCPANADSGDPLFLEPFWMKHAASSALVVAGWHRMSYRFNDDTYISQQLENQIRKLHAITGNAVTQGRYIIFGAGSTQVLNAAIYALSQDNSSFPSKVVASIPFYPLYETQTDFFQSVNYEYGGDTSLWNNTSNITANLIEIVTSPNNPDGYMRKAVLQGSNIKTVYDRAYYWPHFTAIPAPAEEDLMIFTLSKITGHAGSRFGWAVIKDEDVYQRMLTYISVSEMGISRDAQLRALKLLKVVVEGNGRDIYEFAYTRMSERWEKLSHTLSLSKRFSIQKFAPQYCTYFQKVRGPSPGYAWLKCEKEEDNDCNEVLLAANIIGRSGSIFGAGNRYVRLSLLKSQDDFDLMVHWLTKLVTQEDGAKTM